MKELVKKKQFYSNLCPAHLICKLLKICSVLVEKIKTIFEDEETRKLFFLLFHWLSLWTYLSPCKMLDDVYYYDTCSKWAAIKLIVFKIAHSIK